MATAARELVPVKARKVDGRRNNRGTIGNKGGRPEWHPEPELIAVEGRVGIKRKETMDEAWDRTKRIVRHYVAIGYPQEVIARIVEPPCEPDTLRKYFQFELDNGKLIADARMAGTIYQMGVTGRDPAMARFWVRARMGWRDHGEVNTPTAPIQFQKIKGDDW